MLDSIGTRCFSVVARPDGGRNRTGHVLQRDEYVPGAGRALQGEGTHPRGTAEAAAYFAGPPQGRSAAGGQRRAAHDGGGNVSMKVEWTRPFCKNKWVYLCNLKCFILCNSSWGE